MAESSKAEVLKLPGTPETEIAITVVQSPAVSAIWDRVEEEIRKALNSSDILQKLETPQDVRKRCENGEYNLIVITRGNELLAALVVSIITYPRAQMCVINYCGGTDLEAWIKPFYDFIVEGARNLNCRFIHIDGRYSWIKKLQEFGFEKTSEQFTLEI